MTVSRWKMQLGTLYNGLIGTFFALSTGAFFTSEIKTNLLLYTFIYILIVNISCQINAYFDIHCDRRRKKHISQAVNNLGINRLKWIIIIESIIALLLIRQLYLFSPVVATLCFIGYSLGIVYSMPPLRLKKRGIYSQLPMIGGFFFLPPLASYILLTNTATWSIFFFSLGYAFLNQAINMFNVLEDYSTDREHNIMTWAHILGPQKTVLFSAMLAMLGFIFVALVTGINLFFAAITIFFLVNTFNTYNHKHFWDKALLIADNIPLYFLTMRLAIFSLIVPFRLLLYPLS